MKLKNIPVEKNKDYIVNITGMGFQGEGVGRVEDYTLFIEGAIEGEEVKVKAVKTQKNFGFGKLLEVIKPSEYRTTPICPVYKRCGGCQIQHLTYEGQLNFKKNRVKDCIERIGKLEGVTIHNTLGMKNPYRYRNKVQLPVGEKDGEVVIGFFAPRTHVIIDIETCYIQDEVADKVIRITKDWIKEYKVEPYNEQTKDGLIRHIMVRQGFKTGDVMVVLVSRKKQVPYLDEFVEMIRKNIENIKSIVLNINPKDTNVILGEECITLYGQDYITDYIGEFRFNISPLSFFQVNPVQTEVLYNKALEYANLTGEEVVFDAYCGTGTISLFLAKKAKKVYGVEIVPQAIENAWENAKQNNVGNVEFIVGESENVIPKLIEEGIKADVIVVDPPRKGCEKTLLEAIAKSNPKRIVYVSCDPATLARDLAILNDFEYKTKEVQPVDMFPQTAHVECVALIEKK
ncbi:MAG: rRNA (uracil-5-)-methyltransferase RumA [Caloramator sp.]|jgi:23S rRNA (uracil1939-C5)-methyltransferase|uniref:23S rRNA (uracil(1939)-C(5))-methyltransferase RlmD n=1 Tax=Caloramator sp. TaxID=1871330 RepID=UPI001D2AF456|nr:23S rRNA (uracil(1939)-C(5))-methyltransferase RlmD [Caloramator sp.]MBZ4663425.1 rRNA (uracil-5-)-methyltransferase RumA [Caloramator sp.]